MKYLLKFDIASQPLDYDFGLSTEELLSSAVHPPVHILVLENELAFPQNIRVQGPVKGSESGIGVTIEDVLKTIGVHLRNSSSQHKWAALNEDLRTYVEDAHKDWARIQERRTDPWRIEYLRGRNRLQILPKHPLPEDDDGISQPLPHDSTSKILVSTPPRTLLSRGSRWLSGIVSTVRTIRTTRRRVTKTILPSDDEEHVSERQMSKRRAPLVVPPVAAVPRLPSQQSGAKPAHVSPQVGGTSSYERPTANVDDREVTLQERIPLVVPPIAEVPRLPSQQSGTKPARESPQVGGASSYERPTVESAPQKVQPMKDGDWPPLPSQRSWAKLPVATVASAPQKVQPMKDDDWPLLPSQRSRAKSLIAPSGRSPSSPMSAGERDHG